MDLGLAGRTALVTGATSNVGRAIALGLGAEGMNVVACGRDAVAGGEVVAEARRLGAKDAVFVAAELRDADCGNRLLAAASEHFGAVDVLVNNAAANYAVGPFAESDPAFWLDDLDVTFMAALRVTRAVLPSMIERRSGRVINIGSLAGVVGDPMLAVYSAAKGALHAFTAVLAKEVGEYDITVNCVTPFHASPEGDEVVSSGSRFAPDGIFRTGFADLEPAQRQKMGRPGVLTRPGVMASEVAAAVAYLASDQAAFVTGQLMHLNGGALL